MEEQQLDKIQRFERKYVLELNKSWVFRNMLKEKKFHNIYDKRKVFTIYFDTLEFTFFKENIEGVGERIKPRLRWYQNLSEKKNDPISTRFEIKKKKGFIGKKLNFSFGEYKNINDIIKSMYQFDIRNKVSNIVKRQVFPVLITSYDREYYLSNDKKFRSTIDTNLNVASINNLSFKVPLLKEILEIKYDAIYDKDFRNTVINSSFKFRFQKFSKYVVGLLNLKKNGLI